MVEPPTFIPLVDLGAQYEAHKGALDAALRRCIGQTSFIGGPDHAAFAKEFADFCGGGHVALCASGTDALYLAIVELLGQGDGGGEIITVAHTFIATAEAITLAGYRPVFVDVDPLTAVMDIDCLEAALGPASRAILPVHLYGQMVPMDRVMALAGRHGLRVIEDAAQAHGAAWMGRGPGQWGDAACFSFYPGKNLGAWGDGGAVFTRHKALAERIRMRSNHGRKDKWEHEFEGVSSRLDGLQAAILRVKLARLAEWNDARRRIAGRYDALLAGMGGVTLPVTRSEARPVHHLYVIQVEERDAVLDSLRARGIGAGVHYPVPLHRQPAYRHLAIDAGALPVTEILARRVLSLPLYPELTDSGVSRVVEALAGAVGHHEAPRPAENELYGT